MVTAQLKDEGDATTVILTTDLTISGKAAQLGRGVLADVASKLIGQFAERLEADVLADSAPAGEVPLIGDQAAELKPTVAQAGNNAAQSVDLLNVVAMPLAKRVAPVAAGLVAGGVIGFLLGRRRS